VVGAGGNGSIFITHLARIWQAWVKLGGAPFAVCLWDPDVVSEANLARQCFCEADIGQPKALVLAQRIRAFFGVPVEAHAYNYSPCTSDMIVGCVDNLNARRAFSLNCNRYWLDIGNEAHSGQVVLGGNGLPTFFDVFPGMKKARDKKSIPSCSMAESLSRQDLFINSTLATLAGQLLWQLMRHGGLNYHGYIVNLNEGMVLPLPVCK
jgi:PRTRC genetic system ThiF family protein